MTRGWPVADGQPVGVVRVAMVLHSLCGNNVGRVYPFLRALEASPSFDLTVIGWKDDRPLFPLLEGAPCPVVLVSGSVEEAGAEGALERAVPGDTHLLHCFKNRAPLRHCARLADRRAIPLVLDLDDWELGLELKAIGERKGWKTFAQGRLARSIVSSGFELEELARTAPTALTVNSTILKAYFGGEVVYTAADEDAFGPQRSGTAFRQAHAIPEAAPVVGFLGVPYHYKGFDELLSAFRRLRTDVPDAVLLVVGATPENAYWSKLHGTPGVRAIGFLAAEEYPEAYAACDVVAIPQRARSEALMQTPAKLILAMAAGRPIVASRIGDIPLVLGDTGVLVPPNDASALGDALKALLKNPAVAANLGLAARRRFEKDLTLARLREQLADVYARALAWG